MPRRTFTNYGRIGHMASGDVTIGSQTFENGVLRTTRTSSGHDGFDASAGNPWRCWQLPEIRQYLQGLRTSLEEVLTKKNAYISRMGPDTTSVVKVSEFDAKIKDLEERIEMAELRETLASENDSIRTGAADTPDPDISVTGSAGDKDQKKESGVYVRAEQTTEPAVITTRDQASRSSIFSSFVNLFGGRQGRH